MTKSCWGRETMEQTSPRPVEVVAALIWQGARFLICQRPENKARGLLWEFPGGKIEEGESSEKALEREIKEELDADIDVGDLIGHVSYDYESFHLEMDCFFATLKDEHIILKEHEAARWLSLDELDDVMWLPADRLVIEKLKEFQVWKES